MMTVQEARSRLLEFGRNKGPAASALASPAVRMGIAALTGAYLGHRLRRPAKEPGGSSVVSILGRTAAAMAPLLIARLVGGLAGDPQSCAGDGRPAPGGSRSGGE